MKRNKIDTSSLEKELNSIQKWTLFEVAEALKSKIAETDIKEITKLENIKDLSSVIDFIKNVKEELDFCNDLRSNIRIQFQTFIPKFAMLHYSYNKARHKIIASPRGLGKTHNSARIFLEYLLEQDNNMTWFRYTEGAVYDSFVKLFINIIEKEKLKNLFTVKQNKNNGLWEVKSKVSNSILDFRGGFSPHTLKGIEGKNKILLDEATEFTISSILKLEGNIKTDNKVEIWLLFNYGNPSKYIKTDSDLLIEGMRKRGAYFLKLDTSDNIYLSKEYLDNLEGFKHLSADMYYEATGKKVSQMQPSNDGQTRKLNIISQPIKRRFTR
ncbi:phage terminase large subunit [Candidatus Borreliella tachyglossi]|uniref:phage terminase large subunit n=1 Tax=Candidatus Borreliella tachyglossi TaxID=1964448 RepID=UPI0040428945